jgi:hypothetical protein
VAVGEVVDVTMLGVVLKTLGGMLSKKMDVLGKRVGKEWARK